MSWEEFNRLYERYTANDEWMSDKETMKGIHDLEGEFVYDMWQMIKFVKSDPVLALFFEFVATIKAAQHGVQWIGGTRLHIVDGCDCDQCSALRDAADANR